MTLKLITGNMDVTVLARDEEQAVAIMHVIAEEVERTINFSRVTLGDSYRVEEDFDPLRKE